VAQYRVLRLQPGKGYTVQVYRKNKDGVWTPLADELTILDGSGQAWEEIPFTFVGANNNDATIDPSPMYDISEINLGHYRNSADYEDSVYWTGQAQASISGLSEEWRDWLDTNGVHVGARSVLLLPEGSDFKFSQVEPNTLSREAMDAKEKQMIAMGARLIMPGSAAKTATEDMNDIEVEHSVLSLAVANVSEAYVRAINWMARFMGTPAGTIEYSITQEFSEHRLDAQLLAGVVALWQSGKWTEADFFAFQRKYGLVDPEKTDEQLREELETQGAGLGLE